MFLQLLFATLSACIAVGDGYNILCAFPIASKSHHFLGKGIVDALLSDGNQVTWITPFPDKKAVKNLNLIDVSHIVSIVKEVNMMDEDRRNSGPNMVKEFGRNITITMMKTPAVREVMMKGKYDAVVTEWFFSDIQAGIAAVMQCPWLLLNGMVVHPNLEYLVDTVSSPAVVPLMMNDYPVPMSFVQRLKNTLMFGLMMGTYIFQDMPVDEALYRDIFGPIASARGVSLPPLSAALHDISTVFVNSDPALAHAQSLPPNVFCIAGYHLDDHTPPLPQDLQTLLDNSPQGFIYFSMGSVLKSKNFPEETRSRLISIFGKLPYTVLWKFEESLEGLPKNVHVRSWMPQQSILAHPNIKLFITHGGMLSTIEAVHFGVPLLAVPTFGDQPSNAARAQRLGYALTVPFGSENLADDLEVALGKMMADNTYYNKAKSLSKVFRSRLVPPKKVIAHYTRMAIESKGSHHLRSKALLYTWYQRLMFDQLLLLLAIIAAIVAVIKRIVNIFRRPKEDDKRGGGKKKVKKN